MDASTPRYDAGCVRTRDRLAHHLAGELRVDLEFVPLTREHLTADLARGYCDIVMSGVPVTTDLAGAALLSNSYLDETLAFVVPDSARDQFTTWQAIGSRPSIALFRYWILGQDRRGRRPRWSITRNVLHWVRWHEDVPVTASS